MATERGEAESEQTATNSTRAPVWGTVLSILWLMTFIAYVAGGLYAAFDHFPFSSARAHTVLAETQVIFAAYSLFLVVLSPFLSRSRQFSWRQVLFFVFLCALLSGVGYDGFARWHLLAMLPTLDQIAPGPITVAQVSLALYGGFLGLRTAVDAFRATWHEVRVSVNPPGSRHTARSR